MGVESEMELAFTGLHDLCTPMLSYLDALDEPQREALSVALGLASGEPPESFLVALAALNLLAQAAEERPLLCVVDDVQWLDQATAQVLGFVGRRLLAEPVGLVFAARTTAASEDPLAGLPDLRLSGLDEQSACALLASVTTARLDESVRRRILEEAHGNPCWLYGNSARWISQGGFAMPDSVSVPRRIEDQYLSRLRGLPRVTQRLLLVAAADPVGDSALLARAAHTLNLDMGALELAVDAGLLDIGAGVRFRHPLLRSAVYQAAEVEQRRAAHAALAEATDPQLDRTGGPGIAPPQPAADEEVAAELIGSADRAQRRGGVAAAAAFWERAVALTPIRVSGPGEHSRRPRPSTQPGISWPPRNCWPPPKSLRSMSWAMRGLSGCTRQWQFGLNRGGEAPSLLLQAAQRLQRVAADQAWDTYLEALVAGISPGASPSGQAYRR